MRCNCAVENNCWPRIDYIYSLRNVFMADTHRDIDCIYWHIALSILILKGPFGSWSLILCGDAFSSISTFHGLDFDVPYEWIFLEFLARLYGLRRPVSASTFCPFRFEYCWPLVLITSSRICSVAKCRLVRRISSYGRRSFRPRTTALSYSRDCARNFHCVKCVQ